MPTFITSLNGKLLAQVSTEGFDVMSVLVQGACIDDEIADLRVSGGKYPEEGESVYLTWVESQHLKAGDLVEVTFQSNGATLHQGQSFTETPPVEPQSQGDSLKQVFAELGSARRVREGFRLELETNHGTKYSVETTPAEHGFGLTILWNRHRPGRASVSLHSYTIDGLERRGPMLYHVQEYIEPFTTLRFQVGAV